MATPQQQEDLFQKSRLILALNAYKQGQFTSFRKGTSTYNMSRTTAQQHNKGIALRHGSIAPNYCLIPVQEESLKQWILLMDQRGMPPRIVIIQQMAGILAA